MIRRAHHRPRFRLVPRPSPTALRAWLGLSLKDQPWKRNTPRVVTARGECLANRRAGASGVPPIEVEAFLPGRLGDERPVLAPALSAGRQPADWTSAAFLGLVRRKVALDVRYTCLDCFVLDRGRIGRPWMTTIVHLGSGRIIAALSLRPPETVGLLRFQRSPPARKAGRSAALRAAPDCSSPECCRAVVPDNRPEFRADPFRCAWELAGLHVLSLSPREISWKSWLERAMAILVRELFEGRRP